MNISKNIINFDDPQTRYLIDYANLKQGLIKYQKDFLTKENFKNFLNKKELGYPLVLPLGIKYFNYRTPIKIYTISKKEVKKKIFSCTNNNYIGLKIFFKYGNKFCSGVSIKKKYLSKLNYIIDYNKKLILKLKKFQKKNKVCAFQTRNIPHAGHELIIKKIIKKNNIVFINPLIGLKKKGDCRNQTLKIVFNYLSKLPEYKNKFFYAPTISNMNYAGPREALHHCYIREQIGFDQFTVGRDHAGAENIYNPLDAVNFVKNNKNKLKIDIFFHAGAYFCNICKKIVIKNECRHNSYKEISGSDFRKKLYSKKYFKYANLKLQNFLNKKNMDLFY
jgi:sulfate adenylyltransferase